MEGNGAGAGTRVRGGWAARFVPAIWGAAAIVAGLLLLARHGATLEFLARVVAALLIVGGVADLAVSLVWRDGPGRGWRSAGGLVGVLLGGIVLSNPRVGAAVILGFGYLVISGGALFNGAVNLLAGWRERPAWGRASLGACQLVAGVVLLARPLVGLRAFVDLLAAVCIVGGVLVIVQVLGRARAGRPGAPARGMGGGPQ